MEKEDIKKAVEASMNRVFAGNTRVNDGVVENHSPEETKRYFAALAKGESWALKKQGEKIDKIDRVDFSFIEKIDE